MKRFLYGFAVLALFLGAAGPSRSEFIYWTDSAGGDIRRAKLDGSGQQTLVTGLSLPGWIALHLTGGQMYWTGPGGGGRANLDGTEQILFPGLRASSIAFDFAGGKMYWTEYHSGDILQANLDGTGLTILVAGLGQPRGLSLDLAGGKMYWTDDLFGAISRANLDGSWLEVLIRGLSGPRALALDLPGDRMYWTNGGSGDISRANLDGSGREIVISGLLAPAGIALDLANGKMYWTDFSGGDIRRANLDGTGQEILIPGLPSPAGIALDLGAPGTAVYFAVAAPASVPSGNAFDLTITALDPYGNRDVNYQGTVTFTTTDLDSGVVLPADYTFTTGVGGDNGVHTFSGGVTLVTVGDQTVTVTDTVSGIAGSATITVGPGP